MSRVTYGTIVEMATKKCTHITGTGNDRPSLKDLYDHVVNDVADKWKDFGVQLLRSDQEKLLDIIAADHPYDVVSCCKCVLKKWLETTTDATWNQLIKALRSPSIQLDYLAGQLEQMNTECTVASTDTKPTCEKLTSINLIEIEFAKMTNRIKQALINNNVDVVSLIEQLCAISAVKNQKVPLFDEDVFERIKSIDEFWKKLKNFWNIFDYELLQYVVEISDCREAKDIFEKFLSRIDPSEIEDEDLVLHCRVQDREGSLKPVLRIKVNSEKCTLDIKKMVENTVSEAYSLCKYTLRLQGIKKGCVELLYYISKPLKVFLLQFEISESILGNFLTHKIVSLHIDEFVLKIPFKNSDINEKVMWRKQQEKHTTVPGNDKVKETGNLALSNDKVKPTQFIIKKPKKSLSEEEKQSMMRESRILKEIDHDNVIRFYGAVEDLQDQCFKIFLEYADETCGDVNYLFCENEDKESFSGNIALIMLYTQQILFAVDYLHWTGILHLDIKGKNIVVCSGGYRVKLIDFGAACEASGALPQRTEWTPVFAAPEVNNQQQPPKFSADVWSVMCVAVEMVTGNLPWPKETNHQTALFKIGCYEDDQITELVQYDNYWDKYSYYQEHHDMYQELVNMWKMVFRKDSSSRPSAYDLSSLKWMRQMQLNGEQILHDLCSSAEEEQSGVEESHSVENDNVGILINNHSPIEYSSQGYNEEDSRLSAHAYSGHSSPYQSNSPRVNLSQGYPPSAGHSPTGSDSEAYYGCNASLSGRNDNYLSEGHFLQPSSLPAMHMGLYSPMHNYQSSTPLMGATAPQPAFAVDRLRDYSDGRDDSSNSRVRSRSLSVQGKPPVIEQVTSTGRRKSLCYIRSSMSEPINVSNASGIMDNINKANVKRVNSLIYVTEGPKTDSPVSSPRVEEQSLVPETVTNMQMSQRQPRHQLSSSDGGNLSCMSSSTDLEYGLSLDEPSIRRSMSTGSRPLSRSLKLSLPYRDKHIPDGCSEPNDSILHTLQLTSPTSNRTQQLEVHSSTTVKEIIQMTQRYKVSE